MTRQGWLRSVLAISLAACGSEPSDPPGDTGFRVTAVDPADGAADVPWTATFDATLSAALDPASLANGSVELRRDGTRVPSVITYDATGQRVRIVAPLLPGATYRAVLGSGLRSVDGDSLKARTWTVTTRAWDPGLLTGLGQLDYFALALGPSGSVHLFGNGEDRPWSDYATPYMKYVACASNCADPASWGRMAVDSSYEPLSAGALVVSPSGRVHLLHVSHVLGDVELRIGTCASDCLSPANWTLATLDLDRKINGFAQDDDGVLHLVTGPMGGNPELRYATCAAGCTDPANWAATPIPAFGYTGTGDEARGLQVDRGGGLHLITEFAGVLSYTSCASNCLSPAQWSTSPVEGAGYPTSSASLALDDGAGVHLVFTDPDGVFTYARCQANCSDPSAWERVGLDEGDNYGSALTVDETGRITALNPVSSSAELRFLSCVADCLDAANWQIGAAGAIDNFGLPYTGPPHLWLGAGGRLRMVYTDGGRALRYLE
jgi:hypothetical protein